MLFPLFQSTLRRTERQCGAVIGITDCGFQSTLRRTERRHVSKQHSRILTFQSTLRRTERRPWTHGKASFVPYFNPRSDERSDSGVPKISYGTPYFNPRSDERSDGSVIHAACESYTISIHAPTNGATNMTVCLSGLRIFQSTLRRTERQYQKVPAAGIKLISIHAPTNGATAYTFVAVPCQRISIHAPTNGATQ